MKGYIEPTGTLQADIKSDATLQGTMSTRGSVTANVKTQKSLSANVNSEGSLKGTISKPSSSIDAELSLTSTKPVQNKVITAEIYEIKGVLTEKADLVDGTVPKEQLPDMECKALTNQEIENLLKNFI